MRNNLKIWKFENLKMKEQLKFLLSFLVVVLIFSSCKYGKTTVEDSDEQDSAEVVKGDSQTDTLKPGQHVRIGQMTDDTFGNGLPDKPYLVRGTVIDAAGITVVLDRLGIGELKPLYTQKINEQGDFGIDGTIREPELMRIRFPNQDEIQFILFPKDTLDIYADYNDLLKYRVEGGKGGPESMDLLELFYVVQKTNDKIIHIQDRLDALVNNHQALGKLQDSANQVYPQISAEKAKNLKNFIARKGNGFVCLLAALKLDPLQNTAYIEELLKKLSMWSYSRYYKSLAEKVKYYLPLQVGKYAPEIISSTPEGNTLRLSSFKGKYVLIDFWASWCAPCRAENPFTKMLYEKYRNKGFEVLGVSLDDQKSLWTGAIHKDGMSWPQVSDLAGMESAPANTYMVQSIPYTVLVDREGKIVAKDLRGPALQSKLISIFGK